jgi:lysyl-tRNA synthetase class 1
LKLPAWIEEILDTYDERTTPHNEVEIAEAISTVRKSKGDLSEEDFKALLAEHSAFFFIDSHGESSRWGSYFAPMAELGRADGSTLLSPDIAELDDQTLEHWRDRAKSAKNPMMRARYADLVWEFGRRLGDAKRDYSCALIAMEAYVEAANKQLYTYSVEGVRWIVRALDIATAINNKDSARAAADALLSLVASDQNLRNTGIWVAPFDYLYDKKGLLTPEQSAKIIADLEDILARTSVPNPEKNEFDPFGAQAAAERLAQYYRRQGAKAEVERVIKSYGGAFEFLAKDASPMLAMAWLQPVIERYEQENLKADAERVQILAAEKGANIASDLKTYSVEAEIDAEKIEAEIDLLIEGDALDKAMMRVADRFIPKTKFARRLVEDRKKTAPLLSMIKSVIVRSDGQPEAIIDPDDEEGTLHHQINQYMAFGQGILHHSLKRLFDKFSASAEDVVSFVYQSPIFLESRKALLQSGVQAYFDGDFIRAIHVLVPQVEDTLRSLAAKSGVPVYKTVRGASGITDVKSMNNILEDQRVRDMLTEDLWRYLTVLYIDRRGLNLRNDLAHGLVNTESFNTLICDRVIHSLMVLGMMRPKPPEAEPAIEIADAIPAEKAVG